MSPYQRMAKGLAEVFLEGPWLAEDGLVARVGKALGRRPRWLRPLVRRLLLAFPNERPRLHQVSAFLVDDAKLLQQWCDKPVPLPARKSPTSMLPSPGPPSTWPVPSIVTPFELAGRLGLEWGELDWFADQLGLERAAKAGPLRHYDYRWKPKRNGSTRLIESPKGRLKSIQRQILREILAPIPPHDAAHGFRTGRSVRTFVEPHAGRAVVLKMDLQDFFPTIVLAKVIALFRTAGYPDAVASTLAGLCTNRVPFELWRRSDAPISGPDAWRTRQLYQRAHLPQGAPTSPALANLCAFRLDARLAGLAASAGATYTRYADDLAFSGDDSFARSIPRFQIHACAIAMEERFAVNMRKTRVMRQGVRQKLAGAVLNVRPNVPRDDFDALKATLHNCLKHGPTDQNRLDHNDFRAHLRGRIAHVATLNPTRAAKLKAMFDRVAW
jgi:RNA-directed DNA polymerase